MNEPESRTAKRPAWRKIQWTGYLFVAPMVLAIFLFWIYPTFQAFHMSFYKSNGITGHYVGTYNYKFVWQDFLFWDAVYNTLYMGVLGIVLGIPLSFIFASLVNAAPIGNKFFQSLFFAPNVTSVVAASIIFMFLMYPTEAGIMNVFLGWFGIEPLRWFADPKLSKISVIIMDLWRGVGYSMLIWLAGLRSISADYYEAAEMDGAGKLRQWFSITIPMLKPIFFFMVVINTIDAFKRFGEVYMIGGPDGQPGGSLATMMIYIYRLGFNTFEFGKASAASFYTFLFILVFTLINFKLFQDREPGTRRMKRGGGRA